MCNIVIFEKRNISCETVKELINQLPDLELIKNDSYDVLKTIKCIAI